MTLFTADCLRLHAGLCERPGEAATALSSAARILEARPDRDSRELAALYYRIGMNQVAAAKFPAAIANLNMAIVFESAVTAEGRGLGLESGARRLLATASIEYGDIGAADRHLFHPACGVDRDSPEWAVLWSRVLVARGEAALAVEAMERVAARLPGDGGSLEERTVAVALGSALRESGRVEEARSRLRLAAAWWTAARHHDGHGAPGLGLAHLELGRCEIALREFAAADSCLQDAADLLSIRPGARHPHVALALRERARVAELRGRLRAARHWIEQAIEIQRSCLPARHPDFVDSHVLAARVLVAAEPVSYAMLA